jgi:hypothetical protein
MELSIWMSYDLGIRGDYNGLYQWLDTHNGTECGNSIAFVKFEYQTDFLNELKADLQETVDIKNTDRIYVIYYNTEKKQTAGKFLFGNRKAAPWIGYAIASETSEDVL